MTFNDMVVKQRQKNHHISKMDEIKFEVGCWYSGWSDNGGYEPNIKIVRRTDNNVWFDTEYGDESVRATIHHSTSVPAIIDHELVYASCESLSDIKILDNAYFNATSKLNL